VAATDPDGWISRVEYYLGRHKVAESVSAPFTCDCRTPLVGTFQAIAVVYDNKGRKATSDTVSITVR